MIELHREGQRIYVANLPFAVKDRVKSLGAHWDADRRQWWIGTAKGTKLEALVAELNAAPADAPQERPDDIRIVGKARYKGRVYYVRVIAGERARLVTLDAKLDFWATIGDGAGQAVIIKTYHSRTVSDGYGQRTVHQTLGSIREFIAQAERDRTDPDVERRRCWECGRLFSELECRSQGGDWNDSYCGC